MARRQTAVEKAIETLNQKIEALTFARDQLTQERAVAPKRASKARTAAASNESWTTKACSW